MSWLCKISDAHIKEKSLREQELDSLSIIKIMRMLTHPLQMDLPVHTDIGSSRKGL